MDNIRLKYMLECVAQGKAITIEPKSRLEQYLLAMANKTGVDNLPQPQSKLEEYLYAIAYQMEDDMDISEVNAALAGEY